MLHIIFVILFLTVCIWAFVIVISHLDDILKGIWYLVKNTIYYGCIPVTLLILFGLSYDPNTKSTDKWNQVVNSHPQPITHIVKMQPVAPVTPTAKVDLYAEFEDAPPDEFEQYRVTPDKQK